MSEHTCVCGDGSVVTQPSPTTVYLPKEEILQIFNKLNGKALLTPAVSKKLEVHPLLLASSIGHIAGVQKMISGKVNIHIRAPVDGAMAIHLAAAAGHKEVVNLLVKAGADLKAETKSGQNPLMVAVLAYKQDIVTELLKFKNLYDINATDKMGDTALHFAAKMNWCEAVRLLLDAGIDKYKRNQMRRTAFGMSVDAENNGASTHLIEDLVMTKTVWPFLQSEVEFLKQLKPGNAEDDYLLESTVLPALALLASEEYTKSYIDFETLYKDVLMVANKHIKKNATLPNLDEFLAFFLESMMESNCESIDRDKVLPFIGIRGPEFVLRVYEKISTCTSVHIHMETTLLLSPFVPIFLTAPGESWVRKNYKKAWEPLRKLSDYLEDIDNQEDNRHTVLLTFAGGKTVAAFRQKFEELHKEQSNRHFKELLESEKAEENLKNARKLQKQNKNKQAKKTPDKSNYDRNVSEANDKEQDDEMQACANGQENACRKKENIKKGELSSTLGHDKTPEWSEVGDSFEKVLSKRDRKKQRKAAQKEEKTSHVALQTVIRKKSTGLETPVVKPIKQKMAAQKVNMLKKATNITTTTDTTAMPYKKRMVIPETNILNNNCGEPGNKKNYTVSCAKNGSYLTALKKDLSKNDLNNHKNRNISQDENHPAVPKLQATGIERQEHILKQAEQQKNCPRVSKQQVKEIKESTKARHPHALKNLADKNLARKMQLPDTDKEWMTSEVEDTNENNSSNHKLRQKQDKHKRLMGVKLSDAPKYSHKDAVSYGKVNFNKIMQDEINQDFNQSTKQIVPVTGLQGKVAKTNANLSVVNIKPSAEKVHVFKKDAPKDTKQTTKYGNREKSVKENTEKPNKGRPQQAASLHVEQHTMEAGQTSDDSTEHTPTSEEQIEISPERTKTLVREKACWMSEDPTEISPEQTKTMVRKKTPWISEDPTEISPEQTKTMVRKKAPWISEDTSEISPEQTKTMVRKKATCISEDPTEISPEQTKTMVREKAPWISEDSTEISPEQTKTMVMKKAPCITEELTEISPEQTKTMVMKKAPWISEEPMKNKPEQSETVVKVETIKIPATLGPANLMTNLQNQEDFNCKNHCENAEYESKHFMKMNFIESISSLDDSNHVTKNQNYSDNSNGEMSCKEVCSENGVHTIILENNGITSILKTQKPEVRPQLSPIEDKSEENSEQPGDVKMSGTDSFDYVNLTSSPENPELKDNYTDTVPSFIPKLADAQEIVSHLTDAGSTESKVNLLCQYFGLTTDKILAEFMEQGHCGLFSPEPVWPETPKTQLVDNILSIPSTLKGMDCKQRSTRTSKLKYLGDKGLNESSVFYAVDDFSRLLYMQRKLAGGDSLRYQRSWNPFKTEAIQTECKEYLGMCSGETLTKHGDCDGDRHGKPPKTLRTINECDINVPVSDTGDHAASMRAKEAVNNIPNNAATVLNCAAPRDHEVTSSQISAEITQNQTNADTNALPRAQQPGKRLRQVPAEKSLQLLLNLFEGVVSRADRPNPLASNENLPLWSKWHNAVQEMARLLPPFLYHVRNIAMPRYPDKFIIGLGPRSALVCLGYTSCGKTVAVKRVQRSQVTAVREQLQQLQWEELSHPNILPLLSTVEDCTYHYTISPVCECNLTSYVNSLSVHSHSHDPFITRRLSHQMLHGLAFLHRHKIIHGNLKPENVLLDCFGSVRLCDYGLWSRDTGVNNTDRQDKMWQAADPVAPSCTGRELFKALAAADIKVCGMLIYYTLILGRHPYIRDVQPHFDCEAERIPICPEADDLIASLTEHDPTARTTAQGALCHPFFWEKECRETFVQKAATLLNKKYKRNRKCLRQVKDILAKIPCKKAAIQPMPEVVNLKESTEIQGNQTSLFGLLELIQKSVLENKTRNMTVVEEITCLFPLLPLEVVKAIRSVFPDAWSTDAESDVNKLSFTELLN